MPKYAYKARDQFAKLVSGTAEGGSEYDVADRLSERLLTPLTIEELNFDGTQKSSAFLERIQGSFMRMQTRVPSNAVVFFTRQLATMIKAGVPLARALDQLAYTERPAFQKILLTVADDISMGSSFSEAISRHPGAFDSVYVAVVRSGEVAGALDRVMDELATHQENAAALRAKVKGAMRYPIFVGIFVVALIVGILWKLVPIFERMYASFNAELPAMTQGLINVSNVLTHNIPPFFLGAVGVVIGGWLAMHSNRVRRVVHRYILYFPVFGAILKKNLWARYCRTMAILMGAGTPILQATEISAAVLGNAYFAEAIEEVYQRLRRGELLSDSLGETGRFPVLVKQLVATGESTGQLDELLRSAAEFYEREIRVTVDSLASIIEPFLLIGLGGVVAIILIALYLPVFQIGKLMKA
jgi:type II secretory pathway component PulF